MAQMTADMLGLPLENITVKLGDSTLPHAPVEGGSWTAASVSHAIARTSDEVRKELLRLAKMVADSPLAASQLEDVALVDGKIVSKKETNRAVSIADAMRHGERERIEWEITTDFKDAPHMRETRTRRSSRR
jgi:xanthine dehydrogenase YagR molybdenum-binding subunit